MELAAVSGIDQTESTSLLNPQLLGKEDFLRLLVTQLQNQDPLSPMDNKDLVLQLSQFSTLEGTQNLNHNFSKFMDLASVGTYSSMIGKEVWYHDYEQGGIPVSGRVEKVSLTGKEATLTVNGGELTMAQLISIGEPPAE